MIYRSVKSIVLSQAKWREISTFVLRRIGESRASISISFVGERRMRQLNRQHRGLDRATDVLSFSLGDIFLCPSYIRRQARRFGVSYQEECTRTLIHGILHLTGYDHATQRQAKKMFGLQEKLLQELEIGQFPVSI